MSRPVGSLLGKQFGRLKVTAFIGRVGNRLGHQQTTWQCVCECGAKCVVRADGLRSGRASSCGCLQKDRAAEQKYAHGHAADGPGSAYQSWESMRQRCLNPAHRHFDYYGGRGVTICERWHDFENFLADMGDRPRGKTMDRIDPDGNYEPENCRWATPSEQQFNRRDRCRT